MSMVSGIHGQLLEVTVVGCSKLKDTEWISRQDPYVCLDYASTKFRTRTCTDGGKHPTFQEKTVIPLIEGLREIAVAVWNSNTITFDDFIGSGKIQLQKVLSQGYDDSSWPLQSKSGKFAGEVKLIMHFANAQKPQKYGSEYAQAARPYIPAASPYAAPYAPPMSLPAAHYPPIGAYPAASPYPPIPPVAATYPPADPALFPTSGYPPPPMMQQPYPSSTAYPPQPYPPPPQAQPSYYPPQGHYPGVYPPPPYY